MNHFRDSNGSIRWGEVQSAFASGFRQAFIDFGTVTNYAFKAALVVCWLIFVPLLILAPQEIGDFVQGVWAWAVAGVRL